MVGVYEAHPPAFLNGPMSVLLTNNSGFTAHVTFQGDSLAARNGLRSGQLFCRGSKLLFAPAQDQPKKTRTAGFAFIWDVATNGGYVLSGALEGYAPVSSSVHATNVVSQAKGQTEKIEGHPAALETVTVQLDDGTSATFDVWRATDLKGFPVRLSSAGSGLPMILTLTDIRLSPPPEDAFARPDDFAKYSSPEEMADEVVARQHNLHRKSPRGLDMMEPINRPH